MIVRSEKIVSAVEMSDCLLGCSTSRRRIKRIEGGRSRVRRVPDDGDHDRDVCATQEIRIISVRSSVD